MHYLKQTSFCAFWVEPKVYRHFPPCEVGASHVSFEPMVSMTHVHHRWEFAPLVLVFELWDNNFHSTSIQTCGKRSLKHPFVSFDPPNSSCSSDTVVFATAFIAYACAYVCCVHCDLWQVAKAIRPSDLDLPCFKFSRTWNPHKNVWKKQGDNESCTLHCSHPRRMPSGHGELGSLLLQRKLAPPYSWPPAITYDLCPPFFLAFWPLLCMAC